LRASRKREKEKRQNVSELNPYHLRKIANSILEKVNEEREKE